MTEMPPESNFVASLDALASAGGRWLWKSHLRDGLRSFAVDAVEGAATLDEAAREVPDAELDAHVRAGYGIFTGAATAVAARLAEQADFEGKTIVAILHDSGERYLSTPLYEE